MGRFFELWNALEPLKGQGWAINEEGGLRNSKAQCPLCALSDQIAGQSLGFTEELFSAMNTAGIYFDTVDAIEIANAADLPHDPNRTVLMNRLGMTV